MPAQEAAGLLAGAARTFHAALASGTNFSRPIKDNIPTRRVFLAEVTSTLHKRRISRQLAEIRAPLRNLRAGDDPHSDAQ